jgi:SAM-dependent methyltransferase
VTPEERAQAIRRYAERLDRLGPGVETLGWRDRGQQHLRFDILVGDAQALQGKRILDVGCGFGDLYDYLESRGVRAHYTGCDISPNVLQIARERHPALTFEERDILEQPFADRVFDHVFMSGMFNHRLADNRGFMERTLAAAFRASRLGAAANMMTDQVDYRDDHLYYFSPEAVLAFCRTLSPRVALRHDYPLYEFTVFVRRVTEIT